MQNADFLPVLQRKVGEKCHNQIAECQEYVHQEAHHNIDTIQSHAEKQIDYTQQSMKCGWTPKYSPAYNSDDIRKTFSAPHLLPPPPAGTPAPPSVSSTAPPNSRGYPYTGASTGKDYKFFHDRTPAASSARSPATPARSCRTSSDATRSPKRQSSSHRLGSKLDSRPKQQSRIDAEYVPRPAQLEAIKLEGGKEYPTLTTQMPSDLTEVCTIKDTGNCSSEFMRCTMNEIPAFTSTSSIVHIPIATICQPFAELTAHEAPVPVINLGETGPFRCQHCSAYVNPFFKWLEWGREAECNMCNKRTKVPDDYRCSLDNDGVRRDIEERTELHLGTVDYVAPRDYSGDQLPGVPVVVCVLETSQQAVKSGLVAQTLSSLRQLVGFSETPASRIALITFDEAIHFYAFHEGVQDAREIVIADIEDPFLPCSHQRFCVNVDESTYRAQFDSLLAGLHATAESVTSDRACGGSALKVATELAGAAGGGHVLMFHAGLPNNGLGACRNRDDVTLYSQPQPEGGGSLFKPQHERLYDSISEECKAQGVAVSVFCAPAAGVYTDVATLSAVPRATGGDVCYLPDFNPRRDGEQLHYSISRSVMQDAVYSAVFKLRCSPGLQVAAVHAPWEADVEDKSIFRVPRLSVDASAVFELHHTDSCIKGTKFAYMQAACLYTNRSGQRIIRVQTLKLPVTSSGSDVFRYADINSVTILLLRQACTAALTGDSSFKDRLTNLTVEMLHAYRAHCARRGGSPQLILPEALKLLPLYMSTIRKMACFRSGSGMRLDERFASIYRMLGMPIAQLPLLTYPRIYQIGSFDEANAGTETGTGENVYLPHLVRCSEDYLNDSVYLMDSGFALQIYIRPGVSQEQLESTFGCSTASEVPAVVADWSSPSGPSTSEGRRAFAVCQQLRRERNRLPWLPLSAVVPGTPDESRLLGMLAEDHVSHELSYVDYLVHVHSLVMKKIG